MYRVQLQDFEGPLDLLLFFIRRDELDIYDIPIAQITDEFLAYVRVLEQIDLDGVGDFIYMAALLISIKARMLLPTPEVDEEGEPIDPRRELVERLLEYIRYKEAAGQLAAEEARRAEQYTRGDAAWEEERLYEDGEVLIDASVFDLISALRRVLTEAPEEEPVHAVQRIEYSVEEQQVFVLARLGGAAARCGFAELVRARSKPFVIATFLAILELARQGRIWILFGETSEDFRLALREEEPEVPVNGSSNGAAE